MAPLVVPVKKELADDITRILSGFSLASSTPKSSDFDENSYGSSRFDEMKNFKPGNKPAKFVGRCFLQLGDVTPHNIEVRLSNLSYIHEFNIFQQLKEINKQVLPVAYNERFYAEVMNAGEYAKLAYFNDTVVGAVCCRSEIKENRKRLYIMMIGTLAPYRRCSIGTMLISHVLSLCESDKNIESVYLHVQVRFKTVERFRNCFFEYFFTKKFQNNFFKQTVTKLMQIPPCHALLIIYISVQ